MIPTNKDLKQSKWIKDSNQYWLYSDVNEKDLLGYGSPEKNKTIIEAWLKGKRKSIIINRVLNKSEIITQWELLMDEFLKEIFN